MAALDYYRILDVDERASPEEVRRAFRRAAMLHHPDRNPGDPDAALRFRRVHEAYAVLSDPARRSAYRRPPPPPPSRWTAAYEPARLRRDREPSVARSPAAELGEALAILTASATIRIERRFKDLLQYLERL